MRFENTFTVQAPIEEVWTALMDIERVAPAMPGAEVLERTGEDAYKVGVKVRLGPMSMLYRGQVEITERDDAARTAVMHARATEARGQGTATADVHMSLVSGPEGTTATIATDLAMSGRAAAMGAGVIGEVAGALVREFASNLAHMLASGSAAGAAGPPATTERPPITGTPVERPPVEPSQDAPAGGAASALPVGRIAAGVISRRLSSPRTLLAATVILALVFTAIGYAIGRSR